MRLRGGRDPAGAAERRLASGLGQNEFSLAVPAAYRFPEAYAGLSSPNMFAFQWEVCK